MSEQQPGLVPLGPDLDKRVRRATRVVALGAGAALIVLAARRSIPVDPNGVFLDESTRQMIQIALGGLALLGALLTWRWNTAAAFVLALATTWVALLATTQYQAVAAVALTALLLVATVGCWMGWQRDQSRRRIGVLATITLVAAVASSMGARSVWAATLGPTHPDSEAALAPVERVEWVWSGGVSADRATVVARLVSDQAPVRLLATPERGGQTLVVEAAHLADDLVRFEIAGLAADTAYEYAVEVDGTIDAGRGAGSFRTPAIGPTSFRFAAGSCSRSGTNARVFDAIAAEDPLFVLALGDLFYDNIDRADRGLFDRAFNRLLDAPGPASLFSQVPISYVWDDHDYGPNNSDSSSPTQAVARDVFRDIVPSHDLAVAANGPIHRAYTVGRVRFVVTDTRSARTDSTMLGGDQLQWLVDELASASESHALVIWANPTPWIGEANPSSDLWAGRAVERSAIADEIMAAGIDNLVMVSGDAHMLAFDDGTNSGYQQGGGRGFPVVHAAALDRRGTVKGGPYTSETFPGGGQYAVIDVHDDGESIVVEIQGKTWDGEVLIDEVLEFGP